MNLNRIGSSSLSSLYATTPSASVSSTSADTGPVDDTVTVERPRFHGHSGGRMDNDLTTALASLGLAIPSGAADPAAGGSSADSTADSATGGVARVSGSGSDGSSAASIETDLKQFMRALAESVRSALTAANPSGTSAADADSGGAAGTVAVGTAAAGTSSTTGTNSTAGASDSAASGVASGGRRGHLQSGLSALISQVAGGNAPQGLQDAFSKLVADLTVGTSATAGSVAASGGTDAASSTTATTGTSSIGGVSGSASSDGSSTSGTDSTTASATRGAVTLQALLTQLQQNIGYGRPSRPTVGSLVSTQA